MIRRARRILPPYYAALICTLALTFIIPAMHKPTASAWRWSAPYVQHGVLASHMLLAHNLSPEWAYKIDPPMWSVATEWQIYFLFPLLLLPLFRKFGGVATIVVGYVIGLAIHFGTRGQLSQACFWYIGLFAMGMFAAAANKKLVDLNLPLGSWRPALWTLVSFVLCVALVMPKLLTEKWAFASDLLIGLTAMCLLIVNCHLDRVHTGSILTRICDTRPIKMLGEMSYSLYLIHYPILAAFQLGLWRFHANDNAQVVCLSLFGVPAILLITRVFWYIFERPFTIGNRTQPAPKQPHTAL